MQAANTFIWNGKITLVSLLLGLFCFPQSAVAQKNAFKQFNQLSSAEREWVIFHPFKAREARRITKAVQLVVDSVKQSGLIGVDNNGGTLDAFKHAYWMACLAQNIGGRNARKLGEAHEKGNYVQFLKGELEDSLLPDSVSSEMDLRNNDIGILWAQKVPDSCYTLKRSLLKSAKEGCLFIIKKDDSGNFLTCGGGIIPLKEWYGKWGSPKCLVSPPCH